MEGIRVGNRGDGDQLRILTRWMARDEIVEAEWPESFQGSGHSLLFYPVPSGSLPVPRNLQTTGCSLLQAASPDEAAPRNVRIGGIERDKTEVDKRGIDRVIIGPLHCHYTPPR